MQHVNFIAKANKLPEQKCRGRMLLCCRSILYSKDRVIELGTSNEVNKSQQRPTSVKR